ncbi:MAG: LysR family transcriptional regulator [Gammaproteobacteria bacterium SG8_47]|nr:MAG: LysR family transcriptional regulator [Gammaproteobacteria bacterium SG8_47]
MTLSSDKNNPPTTGMPDYLIRHATLRQLQVFEAIVRLGSFTRAAEELFLTQPTVSLQVKKLSDAIGLKLLEQSGRQTRATEAGREVYTACRQIMRSLADLEMGIANLKGLKRGRLRLAVITTAKYFAPEILGHFCRKYPGIDVSLKVTNRDRIVERIIANEDDFYVVGSLPTDELALETHSFAPNPLVVIAARDHPLAGKHNITLTRIAEEPFILREPGSGTRDAVVNLLGERGLRPTVRMELGSNEAIKHAVVGGLGIAIVSMHTLTLEGIHGPVAVLDVEGFPIMRQWHLVYPRNKELSPVSAAFLDFVLEGDNTLNAMMQSLLDEAFPERNSPAGKSARRKKS